MNLYDTIILSMENVIIVLKFGININPIAIKTKRIKPEMHEC